MKRVETININGIVFSIDDDAFAKLSSYIDVLGKNFENEHGGREIIADIEARISELFAEREGGVSRVVTVEDVIKMIETLGTPEDISGADAEETINDEKPPRSPQPQKQMKRLYRDTDKRYLGGVCAGLGAWLGIRPVIVRLIFVLLLLLPIHGFKHFSILLGPGFNILILIYIILWIIIPKAKTTAQKLEMRGEPVNISNIEKNIKESFSDPSLKNSFRNFLNEAGAFFGSIFGIFGRIICFILGLCMFCLGIGFIVLFSLFFMQDIIFSNYLGWNLLSFSELLQNIISPAAYAILKIYAIIVVVLFIFALLFWGLKLMLDFKLRYKQLHVVLFVIWIVAIVAGIITFIITVFLNAGSIFL